MKSSKKIEPDDEWWKKTTPDKWKWKIFYYNKEDKRVFIWGRRYGVGWTVNFARPSGAFLIIGITVLTIIYVTYCIFRSY